MARPVGVAAARRVPVGVAVRAGTAVAVGRAVAAAVATPVGAEVTEGRGAGVSDGRATTAVARTGVEVAPAARMPSMMGPLREAQTHTTAASAATPIPIAMNRPVRDFRAGGAPSDGPDARGYDGGAG